MSSLNQVMIIGRLVRDVDLRYTQSGKAVGNFTVACDRPGQSKEADFIPCVVWEKTAENCNQYISKGSLVAVSGRLQIRSYEDRDGNKRKVAEVVANNVQFLERTKRNENRGDAYEGEAGGFPELDDPDVPF